MGRHWIRDGLIPSRSFSLRENVWCVRSHENILIFSNVWSEYVLDCSSESYLYEIVERKHLFHHFSFFYITSRPDIYFQFKNFFRRRIFRYDTCELEISIWKKILIWISTYFHLFPSVDLFFRALSMSEFFDRRFSQMGIINSLHGHSSGTRLFFYIKNENNKEIRCSAARHE